MWFDIIKTLLELYDRKKEIEQEKRQRLSEAFQMMADVVKTVIKDLEHDVYPSGSCIAMEELAKHILNIVGKMMPEEEAEKLSKEFSMASKLELEYAMRKNGKTIPHLQEVSGKLTALSILYSI
jgi:uncharacterized membrane-anchored protein YhcB (DUF1043 family)